ncbi:MAG TPA: hypothetical protein VLS89_15735, partial [Candidatus Nanopelagicales bacterium]|nr:hypothetical protein [Candidatus Nanopelagicales bacterium]
MAGESGTAGRVESVSRRCWVDRALCWVATALPFALALSRAASAGQWRDDLSAVRDLGFVAVGLGGGLSTPITQALGLIPLGPRGFRAALGSALALAVAARLLYGLTRELLLAAGRPGAQGAWLSRLGLAGGTAASPRLASLLAAIATLTAALSPTWQREATIGGGAMLATAGALLSIRLAERCVGAGGGEARPWVALGAVIGAVAAESPPAGLSALGAVLAMAAVARPGEDLV